MNLDNVYSAQSTVQTCRQTTTSNGCKVTLIFPASSPKNIRLDVAIMLLAAFVKRRSVAHEAGIMPVQSFN